MKGRPRRGCAGLVVFGGVCAALHVGKLPTALPVLRDALGITLVESGFMLSLVQLAGMLLGVAIGLAADSLGLKRTMVAGLVILAAASAAGAGAQDATTMLALRAAEGLGVLLAAMPAPSLLRRLVPPERVAVALGFWGAYMPFGTAAALVAGPFAIAHWGWRAWWLVLAAVCLAMAAVLWLSLPSDTDAARGTGDARWRNRLASTLSASGPWLIALAFAAYSAQWLAVIGFLPSMYVQAGWSPAAAGAATAFAAAANMAGNIASGPLQRHDWRPDVLLLAGFATMGVCGFIAFAGIAHIAGPGDAVIRYAAAVLFSGVGGLIPGTLFSLAIRLAPGEGTVSTTVGWMQQWSSAGQLAGPPLVAWVAARANGFQSSGWVTASFAIGGIALSFAIGTRLRGRAASA